MKLAEAAEQRELKLREEFEALGQTVAAMKLERNQSDSIRVSASEFLKVNGVDIKSATPHTVDETKSILSSVEQDLLSKNFPIKSSSSSSSSSSSATSSSTFDEEAFNYAMTETFKKLFSSEITSLQLFNSERHLWLKSGEQNERKPDFNFVHEAFIKIGAIRQEGEKYGGPHHQFITEVLFILEGKIVPLTNHELSQIVDYLGRLGIDNNPEGLLYNQSEWLYIKFVGFKNYEMVRGKWTDGGSENFLKSKIYAKCNNLPILTKVVLAASVAHRVEFTHSNEQSCFLGGGRDGKVFEVRASKRGDSMALKIGEYSSMCREYDNLKKVLGADYAVQLIGNYELQRHSIDGVEWGSFVIEKLDKEDFKVSDIAVALSYLHVDKIVHGDPRKQNLMKATPNNSSKWIDFNSSSIGNATKADVVLDFKHCMINMFKTNQLSFVSCDDLFEEYVNICFPEDETKRMPIRRGRVAMKAKEIVEVLVSQNPRKLTPSIKK